MIPHRADLPMLDSDQLLRRWRCGAWLALIAGKPQSRSPTHIRAGSAAAGRHDALLCRAVLLAESGAPAIADAAATLVRIMGSAWRFGTAHEALMRSAGNEGRRLSMLERRACLAAPAAQARHLRRGRGLIDERQPMRLLAHARLADIIASAPIPSGLFSRIAHYPTRSSRRESRRCAVPSPYLREPHRSPGRRSDSACY